jgi:predicted homoserine dehydrogenase-like protein
MIRDALRIGVAGTGFIARGLVMALEQHSDLRLTGILTRRQLNDDVELPRRDLLTNSLTQLLDQCDLVVECSGDVLHATHIVDAAVLAEKPIVTMNAEFHVTTGSYFCDRGVVVTEAEGDQPGSLAALAEEARGMGFRVLVYGNRKGYYHPNPPVDQMRFWAKKQGLTLDQVTAATDGTKLQIEQALIANGLGATLARSGMLGVECETLERAGQVLAGEASRLGRPIADYAIAPKAPAGIFVACEIDSRQKPFLEYFKLGPGPFYVLVRNYHLCHLEIAKTIRRVRDGFPTLLNNSATPMVSVAAIAKRDLAPGERIPKGIGSFELRGEAVLLDAYPDHLPIGLVANAVVKRRIEAGQRLTFDDIEISENLALTAWQTICRGGRGTTSAALANDRTARFEVLR